MRLRYCDGKDKYFPHTRIKDVEKKIFLIKQLAKHLILSQGWLIKGTGYEYDGNVFVAWVLPMQRAEVVPK